MNILRNLKLSLKFFILLTIASISLIIVGTIGYLSTQFTARGSEIMYSEQLIPNSLVQQIQTNNRALDTFVLEMMVTKEPRRNGELNAQITSILRTQDKNVEKLKKIKMLPEQKKALASYEEKLNELRELRNQAIELATANKNDEAYELYTSEVAPVRSFANRYLATLQELNTQQAEVIYKQNQQDAKEATNLTVIVLGVSLLLLMTIGTFIARLIAQPIRELRTLALQAADGDFTVESTYKSKDEIGVLTNAFTDLIQNTQRVIHTTNMTSEQVAASSQQLSASAQQSTAASQHISSVMQELADGATQQASSVEQSLQVIENMAMSSSVVYDHIDKAAATAKEASDLSAEGSTVIQTVNTQMNSINDTVISLSTVFQSLAERSNEIERINEVITNIAGQTNLLALNAAIEAARAGEHGKGFAVVAAEVRKLAEQSAQSAEQISSLITLIQRETQQTTESIDSALEEVKEGMDVTTKAGTSFATINKTVTSLAAQIKEVTATVEQLSIGTAQVTQAIFEVNGVAEEAASSTQNAAAATEEQLASMEEITSSSTALASLAQELQESIQRFKV
ncbi:MULTISPECIES: methyl-accepting chemotaxis protein [Bacillaceae]|uniref:methyl-accepting chemotaxis protein n=1 Tax=Bacillaceae TaxID=186817 RepID=UPI0010518B20|nr:MULTISPECIES: methyl-accepting chemotaxis protein [Bacillaceae]MDT2047817.1 methyl-accepting chemotaxis protein [Priestia flexa]TDB55490.1 methyl-accepting chemotaxis protein [Bacillus sp. CBEL-1]USY56091.1 methyl-accepting chemotaxis protein [Bacillus sp. 1780r2a1]